MIRHFFNMNLAAVLIVFSVCIAVDFIEMRFSRLEPIFLQGLVAPAPAGGSLTEMHVFFPSKLLPHPLYFGLPIFSFPLIIGLLLFRYISITAGHAVRNACPEYSFSFRDLVVFLFFSSLVVTTLWFFQTVVLFFFGLCNFPVRIYSYSTDFDVLNMTSAVGLISFLICCSSIIFTILALVFYFLTLRSRWQYLVLLFSYGLLYLSLWILLGIKAWPLRLMGTNYDRPFDLKFMHEELIYSTKLDLLASAIYILISLILIRKVYTQRRLGHAHLTADKEDGD